ncbi:hypothetical protein ANN_18035 [Periplaneta americana]|uniref:Uncharacterized protein n=1 Tax=Periplaneta americana TaxID=6978 RepID=A0ABQ8SPQ2_PERAM|nr:hypothetical protein ANN_18035 [Periplaneta americana]
MSPGSSTESYPAFARIGLRENPEKPQPVDIMSFHFEMCSLEFQLTCRCLQLSVPDEISIIRYVRYATFLFVHLQVLPFLTVSKYADRSVVATAEWWLPLFTLLPCKHDSTVRDGEAKAAFRRSEESYVQLVLKGSWKNFRRKPKERKLNERDERHIVQQIRRYPGLNVEKLRSQVQDTIGKEISNQTIRRVL